MVHLAGVSGERMKLSALLAPLIASKADHATIMDVVLAFEAEQVDALERRRANDRERQERRRHVMSRDVTVTVSSREGVTRVEDNLLPEEITGQKENKKKTLSVHSHPEHDEDFEKFWAAYPKRDGPNPRKPAFLAFKRAIARGVRPETLIRAAAALAAEHPTPTRFVPQAVTFLNQDRWEPEEIPVLGDEFCPSDWPATRPLVIRFRNENNNHDPPPAVQNGKAGYLLPAGWVQNARNSMNGQHRLEG